MGKINPSLLWQGVIGFCITFLGDVIVNELNLLNDYCTATDFPCGVLRALVFVIALLVVTAMVHIMWIVFTKNKTDKSKGTELSKKPEIIFYNRLYHEEFFIENASPDQVMNYIKDSISSTLWYLHMNNKVAYDVDKSQTRFYDPKNDNTIINGIIFSGIRYELDQQAGGILNRKNGEKIPELFSVSISPAGLGNKTKLLVKFNTEIEDACGFLDVMKKELKKIFDVKETETWLIS